jgi:hypothetical protein
MIYSFIFFVTLSVCAHAFLPWKMIRDASWDLLFFGEDLVRMVAVVGE